MKTISLVLILFCAASGWGQSGTIKRIQFSPPDSTGLGDVTFYDWKPRYSMSGYTWNPDSEKPVMFWPQFFSAWDEWRDSCMAGTWIPNVHLVLDTSRGVGGLSTPSSTSSVLFVYAKNETTWHKQKLNPDNLPAFMEFLRRRLR